MKGRVYLLRRREKRAGRRGKKKRAGATESDPKDRVLETHQIYDLRIQIDDSTCTFLGNAQVPENWVWWTRSVRGNRRVRIGLEARDWSLS